MRRRRISFQRFMALCSLGLAACASGGLGSFPDDSTVHPAQALPERFEPVAPATRVAPADTIAGNGCTSPLRDPRDGTLLRMERAIAPRADYSVPAGRYGVGSDELLRLDCNTGIPIGIVRR
ncbi:MAG: hypothetical protein ACM31F_02260 [Gemmatimonas sp.]